MTKFLSLRAFTKKKISKCFRVLRHISVKIASFYQLYTKHLLRLAIGYHEILRKFVGLLNINTMTRIFTAFVVSPSYFYTNSLIYMLILSSYGLYSISIVSCTLFLSQGNRQSYNRWGTSSLCIS